MTDRNPSLGFRRITPARDTIWRDTEPSPRPSALYCHREALEALQAPSSPRTAHFLLDVPCGLLSVHLSRQGVSSIHFQETLWERFHHEVSPLASTSDAPPSVEDQGATSKQAHWLRQICALFEHGTCDLSDDVFLVTGTAFQKTVWEALRSIPWGERRTYSDIAVAIGRPTATRAVASACAANVLAGWVPCHRVIPKYGGVGDYRWGAWRKKLMLGYEFSDAA